MPIVIGDADDNDLTGTADADELFGLDGSDSLTGGGGGDLLDGGDGYDVVRYEGSSAGVNVHLELGGLGGDAEGDEYVDIEDVIGSAFGDIITGDAGSNYLSGGDGDDIIEGREGNDVIAGGAGRDSLIGGDGLDILDFSSNVTAADAGYGLVLDMRAGRADVYVSSSYTADRSTVSGFEVVIGTAARDWMRGGGGDDLLSGYLGDDVLIGGDGADTLHGEAGRDTASYADAASGVEVSLFIGEGSGGDAEGDVLISIENLIGSAFDDILEGDLGDNLIAGGAGADILFGELGFDTLDYRGSTQSVFVNLSQSRASGGDAQGDLISGFEAVIGSARSDRLHGGAGDQMIEGGLGNDQMHGGSGVDTLSFEHTPVEIYVNLLLGQATGAGNDTLSGFENIIASSMSDILIADGGDNVLAGMGGGDDLQGGGGFDTADYSRSTAAVSVNLATGAAVGGHAQGDVLDSIEGLIGSDHDDTLVGDAGDNRLDGGAGSDLMDGGDGIDTLSYRSSAVGQDVNLALGETCGCSGDADTFSNFENVEGSAFDDILTGDAGANVLTGGLGWDVLNGGDGLDTASYAGSSVRVIVNLNTGFGASGEAEGDQYVSIERLVGSAFNDRFYGGAGAEVFESGAGHDRLYGRRGDDRLEGGAGDDILNGGAGADTFVLRGDGLGQDVIEDFSVGLGDVILFDDAVFADFADVMAHTTNDGSGNCVISKGGVNLTLTGVLRETLGAGDFQFETSGSTPIESGGKAQDPLVLPDDAAATITPALALWGPTEWRQAGGERPASCETSDLDWLI